MKIEDVSRQGLVALGVLGAAGLAASALAGFAVGMAVSRDPQALKRSARALALQAARGVEQATLLAAQAREHLGDLWAEAREEALAEVDAADFARAAATAPAAGAAPANARRTRAKPASSSAPAAKKPRAKARSRKRPPTAVPDADGSSTAEVGKSSMT